MEENGVSMERVVELFHQNFAITEEGKESLI
jgi:hypothetical protein